MTHGDPAENLYVPLPVEVLLATRETADVETFRLELSAPAGADARTASSAVGPAQAARRIDFQPGQFVVLSILGVGECPLAICSSPTDGPWIELTVRKVGRVTAALYGGPPAGALGLRGPRGKGFDLAALRGRPLVCAAGGIGLAPLRSLVHFIHAAPQDFGSLTVLYGARTPQDRLYRNELESWLSAAGTRVLQIVETDPEGRWTGRRGTVGDLLGDLDDRLDGAAAVLCGPQAMLAPLVRALEARGLAAADIHLALERRMSCGLGKCGHCYVGEKLVCTDGPVFTAHELRRLGEPL